ncbi:hypothetical protein G3I44_05540 [Halogeometricum borinquense]|uniref:DUF8048 domain-containing protein n=1 Tax=Halogeometricum borinquense TaxID=60847 RepID=A0A6C0UG70_9EURY|nr:hypothetical protein [Halogeometricum borinquense]QIB72789.1 hypothetical protein G3I44_05540 [Halogeometricum borinquense]
MTTDTDPRRPLAAFDGDVIARVAREMSIEEATLREAIAEHQRGVRSLPGVEDIVYEWRRTLPQEPLIARRTDAYFLVVNPAVWQEFIDALGLSENESDALRTVHDVQLIESVGEDAVPADGREAIVLTRP